MILEELKKSPAFPIDQNPKCSVTEVMFLELMGAGNEVEVTGHILNSQIQGLDLSPIEQRLCYSHFSAG